MTQRRVGGRVPWEKLNESLSVGLLGFSFPAPPTQCFTLLLKSEQGQVPLQR